MAYAGDKKQALREVDSGAFRDGLDSLLAFAGSRKAKSENFSWEIRVAATPGIYDIITGSPSSFSSAISGAVIDQRARLAAQCRNPNLTRRAGPRCLRGSAREGPAERRANLPGRGCYDIGRVEPFMRPFREAGGA